MSSAPELRELALAALCVSDPTEKMAAAAALSPEIPIDATKRLTPIETIPGRPARPQLVAPQQVKQRAMSTLQGRAAMVHSLAHIEFNAINLALDIIWRYPDMPMAFYRDWALVAREEAYHYGLLSDHLGQLGHQYGDLPAHDGLWEMAERTQDDLAARLALVPRTLEARGLDASPVVRRKFADAGDDAAACIIDIILRDEIGHVRIGNDWYRYLCDRDGRDAVTYFDELALQYRAPRLRGPFNLEARRAAGFTEDELEALQRAAAVASGRILTQQTGYPARGAKQLRDEQSRVIMLDANAGGVHRVNS